MTGIHWMYGLYLVYFFVTSVLFFMSGVSFRRGMATYLLQREHIKATLKKVNFTAFICTVIFGIRFISWAYGSLVYNLYLIPETTWMWDLDQIFYPTIHYTLPDIIPDIVLLRLLSPNTSEYVIPENYNNFDDDTDSESGQDQSPVINYQLSINSDQKNNRSYASIIDQDDDERRMKKKKKSTSSTGSNSFHSYKKDGSFLLGSKSFYTEADVDNYSQDSGTTRTSSDSNVGKEHYKMVNE